MAVYCLTQLKVHFRPLNKVRQELCKEVQEILQTYTIFTFRNLMELGLKIQFQNHDHCMDLQNSAVTKLYAVYSVFCMHWYVADW